MPFLPDIEVETQAQADRIKAAYRSKYGTATEADTVAAYRRDIMEHIISTVMNQEASAIMERQTMDRNAELEVVKSELPDPENLYSSQVQA